jgi:DNA-binding response OmpR family regulator
LLFNVDNVHYIESIIIMKKVLFLNNRAILSIVPKLLTVAGFVVDIAHDDENGLQLLNVDNYDLIITVESPNTESWRLCKNIRHQTTKPLIVISNNASTETCVQAINSGADFFLRKPFGALEFLARVNALLQRSPRKVVTSVP